MKRFGFALILFFGAVIEVFPQDKLFTVEDVVGGYRLAPSNLRQLNWIPNSDIFAWSDGTGEKSVLLYSSSKSSKIDTLLKLTELNSSFSEQNEKTVNSFQSLDWNTTDEFDIWNGTKYFSYNIKYKKLTKLNSVNDKASNRTVAPNQKYIAYTIENNLFASVKDTQSVQITFDKDINIV